MDLVLQVIPKLPMDLILQETSPTGFRSLSRNAPLRHHQEIAPKSPRRGLKNHHLPPHPIHLPVINQEPIPKRHRTMGKQIPKEILRKTLQIPLLSNREVIQKPRRKMRTRLGVPLSLAGFCPFSALRRGTKALNEA